MSLLLYIILTYDAQTDLQIILIHVELIMFWSTEGNIPNRITYIYIYIYI